MIVNRLPLSFALVLPLVLAACGEGLTLPPEGEAAHITVVAGDSQSARVGSTLSTPLLVEVTDSRDRPVSGATVVFSFPSAAAGEASPASATTNADGQASSTLRVGSVPDTVTGKAEVPVDEGGTPVEVSFTIIGLSDDADGIAPVSGDGQSAPVNSTLPAPLVVRVTDQFGNPISGVPIDWTFDGDGSLSAASTVTGADGQASVTRTLGSTAGQQTTLATVDGLAGSPVTFTHTATAGSATGVVKVSGDGQSALVGTELALPLVVQVLDALGNPIPNRFVTWVTGDGSVNPDNTTTDAQGHASTRWTLGPTPGAGKTANAVVSGVGTATFTATATAGAPSGSTSTVSASPETITAGGTSTITVTVRDASNNPVAGVSVTLASTGTGNSINPATASSGANGVATFTFSSTVIESKTITATAGGVTIDDQATITVQKVNSTIRITSHRPDPSNIGQEVRVEFRVTGPGGTPTGDVTISGENTVGPCTVPVSTGFCNLVFTAVGTHQITATYGGDDRFGSSVDEEDHSVVAVTNLPPVAQADAYQTNEDVQLVVNAPGVLSNDQDPEGGSLSAADASDPPNGTVSLNADGSFTYTPDANFSGSDQFTYNAKDPAGNSTAATVTIQVAPVNDQPVANADAYSTPGGGAALSVAAPGVLDNDSDPDGPPLSAQNATGWTQGSVSLNSDGSFTYTPNEGASGSDSFTYEASDGSLTSQATVTITISP